MYLMLHLSELSLTLQEIPNSFIFFSSFLVTLGLREQATFCNFIIIFVGNNINNNDNNMVDIASLAG